MESNYLYFIKLYVPSSEISELWSLFVVLRPSPLCFFNSVKESFSFPMNISFGIQRCHSVSVKKRNAHEKISQYFMYPSSYCFISVLSFIAIFFLVLHFLNCWNIIALQCCVSAIQKGEISYMYVYMPSLLSLPPLL